MSELSAEYRTASSLSGRQYIHQKYLDILKRLENGRIYGVPITPDDLEILVVASYFAGQADVQKAHAGRLQLPPL